MFFVKSFINILLHGKIVDKVIAWGILVALALFIGMGTKFIVEDKAADIPASTFFIELDNDNIAEMKICHSDGSVSGQYREEVDGYKKFETVVPANSNVLTQVYLDDLNRSRQVQRDDYETLEYTFNKQSQLGTLISSLLMFIVEFIVIVGLFVWLLKRNGGGSLFGVNDSKNFKMDIPKTTFADVAGIPEAIEEVSEVVTFLKDPKQYDHIGAKFPKGILLQGPGGCGKTLLARALAGEAGVPFIHVSGSDFVEIYVGTGAKRIRQLFAAAKKEKVAIIFIDEIDAIGTDRDSGVVGDSEHLQTINALLSEMDGFEVNDGVIVIAATNRADSLDKALIRPGRFDRIISVDVPAKEGRIEILQHYSQNKKFAEDIDFDKLAKHTYGFSGAQLENVMNQAATLAARRSVEKREESAITMKDLDEGISRTISGPAMKSKKMSDKERRETAYHEAGHAIVQYILPDCDEVQKISIVSRYMPGVGMALGYVQSYNEEDTYVTTADKCRAEISSLLAGRVSEKYFCGIESAGASNDLERASELAYNMVDKFGFSNNHGLKHNNLRVEVRDRKSSLIKAGNKRLDFIDKQVENILNEQYIEAENIINKYKHKVEKVAKELIKNEVIDSTEIKNIMELDD